MPPYSQFLSDSPSQGSSTYPCDREKGTAYAVPPVNLWLSPDRASGLRKRQKGQLALSFLSIHGFHRTAQRSEKKDKRDSLRRPSCQSMAFTRPRQRSGKKTKGTTCAVPLSIYGFHRAAPAVWEKDKRDSFCCLPCQSTAFTGPRQRSEKKDKRDSLRCPSCQSIAFTGPRQRSGKKTKGTARAVPPVYGVIIKFR